jgi:hypothetical protein
MKHALLGLLAAGAALADTTITIQTNVVTPGVRRLGLNIAMINYYDSGQLMKELLFNNPGFEGLALLVRDPGGHRHCHGLRGEPAVHPVAVRLLEQRAL